MPHVGGQVVCAYFIDYEVHIRRSVIRHILPLSPREYNIGETGKLSVHKYF